MMMDRGRMGQEEGSSVGTHVLPVICVSVVSDAATVNVHAERALGPAPTTSAYTRQNGSQRVRRCAREKVCYATPPPPSVILKVGRKRYFFYHFCVIYVFLLFSSYAVVFFVVVD